MTNQEQAYYNFLKKETAEIEHQGRGQWPISWTDTYKTHQIRRAIPTNLLTPQRYGNTTIIRNVTILDAIQIANELKMAERKHFEFGMKPYFDLFPDHMGKIVMKPSLPDRTKAPVANLDVWYSWPCYKQNSKVVSTPQNYQGGRE